MNNLQKAFKTKAKMESSSMRQGFANGGVITGAGTGTSDEVPIAASHGEYILPADTVQALGVGNLDALKDATHNDVGMRAPGMFANGGLIEDPLEEIRSRQPSMRQVGPGLTQNPATGVFNQEAVQNPGRTMARPVAAPVAPVTQVGAGVPSTAADLRTFDRTVPESRLPRAAAPVAPAAPVVAEAAPVSRLAGAAEGVGRTAGNLARMAAPLLRTTAVASPLSGFGDYKVNDPGVDSSAAGTVRALAGGDFAGAGRSLRNGALEAGLDSVSGVAKTVDTVGGLVGLNPGLRDRFDGAVRGQLGNQLVEAPKAPMSAPTLRTGVSTSAPPIAAPAPVPQAAAPDARDPALTPSNVNQNVANFQQQYGAAAQRAGDALGVDPKLLLAQWGNETGWGKSVIPGTNNLGNIKDFSGGGVGARDNMTGSNDRYRTFASPEDFADNFVGLMQRKYPGVAGAGSDAAKFTAGLNGYAEDKQYGNKVTAAFNMLNGVPADAAARAQADPSLRSPLRAQASWTGRNNIAEDGFSRDGRVEEIRGMRSNFEDGPQYNSQFNPNASRVTEAAMRNFAAPGEKVEVERENNRALREGNQLERERQAGQFAETNRIAREAQTRQTNADEQKRQQDANSQLQKDLEARNSITGKDGKPTFDADAVGVQRRAVDKALSTLGAKSAADLDPIDKDRVLAGAKLLAKVQADATNWPIPWKPDFIKSADASSMIGMVRLPNGDGKLRSGQVIPARYIDKEGADRVGGKPTDEFNVLFAKGN